MLTVARKPIVQYVAEELVANGLSQILFVTSRAKISIENHFESDPELTRMLKESNKTDLSTRCGSRSSRPSSSIPGSECNGGWAMQSFAVRTSRESSRS